MNESAFLNIPLFRDITSDELVQMVNELPIETYEAGSYLFRDGDPGENLYVVKEGHLEILLAEGSPDEMLLKICGPGEYVGEMGLILAEGKRTATVRAKDRVRTWVMSRAKFTEALQRWPVIAYSMVNILSERLDATNDSTFRDLTEKNHALQQRAAELAFINSVQAGLASQLDVQAIYDLVGDKICELFGAETVAIAAFDPERRIRRITYQRELGQRLPDYEGPFNKLSERLLEGGQPLIINGSPEALQAEYGLTIMGRRPRSLVCVPYGTGGRVNGFFSLQSAERENAFSDSDVRLLQTLASSLGIALEKAHLFEETQRLLVEAEQRNAELRAAQAQLVEKERLERELKVAADIQLSILPDVLPSVPGFDFGARILPARRVGGDFYDVFAISDGETGIVIGDVADKGVPAALFMARAHALIMAEADNGISAGEVLRLANGHITHLQKAAQFVTALYGILDLATCEFAYARAGHEPPLVLQPDGTVARIPHGPGMSLGLWEAIQLDERVVKFEPGSTLVLFTDGMTDCRNPKGVAFGLTSIKNALAGMAGLPAQEVCDRLFDTLMAYQNGAGQDDDVTLVAIHRAP